MFRPNTYAMLSRRTGHSLFGKAVTSPPVRVPVAVVSLNLTSKQTPIRTDSSASRAAAEMMTADAMLLFPKSVTVKNDDIVTIAGARLKVAAVQPRLDITGKLDHFEVLLMIQPEDDS